MKLKDIKVGMKVVDRYGNEYVVKQVDKLKLPNVEMPVRLKSTKILRSITASKFDVEFHYIGETYWIYKSKKAARRDGFHKEDIITVKSLKLKDK